MNKKELFLNRTKKHIYFVNEFGNKLLNSDLLNNYQKIIFKDQIRNHDKSKFEFPEFKPYIYINWDYYCKRNNINFNPSDKLKDIMNIASEHHVNSNKHHPEFWDENKESSINRENRDKPLRLIDATKMNKISVAEMVCDWCAMAKELNDCPVDWANKNIGIRWNFNNLQKKFIYKILNKIWRNSMNITIKDLKIQIQDRAKYSTGKKEFIFSSGSFPPHSRSLSKAEKMIKRHFENTIKYDAREEYEEEPEVTFKFSIPESVIWDLAKEEFPKKIKYDYDQNIIEIFIDYGLIENLYEILFNDIFESHCNILYYNENLEKYMQINTIIHDGKNVSFEGRIWMEGK